MLEVCRRSCSSQIEIALFSEMKPHCCRRNQSELGPLQHGLVGVFASLHMKGIPVEVENSNT